MVPQRIIKMYPALVLTLFCFLIPVSIQAASLPDTDTIPSSLQPWKPWVLHGMEDRFCPTPYNRGDEYLCTWPSRLKLDLDGDGGRFSQSWLVYKKGRVPLPGGKGLWPLDVRVDGKGVPVVGKTKKPSVYLVPGKHLVEGRFLWSEMPELIHIPEASGLVGLSINGRSVDFPLLDGQGRLWLKKRKDKVSREERTEVKAYRLLNDTIPMRVTNYLKINISGPAREIKLNGVLLEGFVPLSINSPLPARLGQKGALLIQARPGRWEVRLLTRSEGPVKKIAPSNMPYGREIWAFQSQNHLRMVRIQGVEPIDPNQTDTPQAWKRFPSFIIKPGDEMTFEEGRRGDPDPAPDRINLVRTWWLDFDGTGLTIHDRITGTMSRHWYLAMNPAGLLGRVSVDGVDQLITAQGEEGKPGVELRRGRLDLSADSRFEKSNRKIPAVGWDHDFQSVSGRFNLPPGWRLLTAQGVDVMPGTWFEQWTLLDLFLVLIISLAVFKLWNLRWGILALVTVALIYHEPGSPRLVWLHLLAASALVRFLPEGWFKKLVGLWRLGAIVTLLVLAIPFMVQQVRWGVYPQLEPVSPGVWRGQKAVDKSMQRREATRRRPVMKKPGTAPPKMMERRPVMKKDKLFSSLEMASAGLKPVGGAADSSRGQAVLIQDPNALIQTGPGLPDWKWRSYNMKWNGPVNRDQEIRLWLLSPAVNLVLAVLRVLLLAYLIFVLMGFRKWKMPVGKFAFGAIVLCVFLFPGTAAGETEGAGYPSPELLKQLQERLLEKPECLPVCAEGPHMEIRVDPNTLVIRLKVHAAIETAIPLPNAADLWRPEQVLLDSRPAGGLFKDGDGLLWVLVPEGIHDVTLKGGIAPGDDFQISLPVRPYRVNVESIGWRVQGIDKDGRVRAGITFNREKKSDVKVPAATTMKLPPFLHIERVLSLGLEWKIITTVRRVSPAGTPVAVSVPLIDGESVTSEGITVENGKALIHLSPHARVFRWNSTLETNNILLLTAPQSVPWTETWILDASPIWHCEATGISVIHHQDRTGRWKPQWKPWPGEQVSIRVTRPKAIAGQTLTIDKTRFTLEPGQRFDKAALSLQMRSSRGGQHRIILPDDAKLQRVRIMGKTEPVKEQKKEVVIPLRPGKQTVDVEWHQKSKSSLLTRSPRVGLGRQAVNADVVFQMPKNRWILLTLGPRLGPAVLFWSYLAVIILAALGLGRVSWTPLKTGHWVLLGLGLTQVHPLVSIMIVGWLLALGLRRRYPLQGGWFTFNAGQLVLAVWTIAAMIGLYISIKKGLLGIPNMQISGNGSSAFWLHWTQDRVGDSMTRPWVLSLPMYAFRILMLFWALWLAHSLLKWLRWGWQSFSEGGLWKKPVFRKRKQEKTAKGESA